MGNMYVHKIGMKYLEGLKTDKNSGLYELSKIKEIASRYNGNKDILVVVGGSFDEDERLVLMQELEGKYDYKVFVMTDTSALRYSNFLNAFDLVLHQSVSGLPNVTTKQMYGFMPEMFYNERNIVYKCNLVLFAGNDLNRSEELVKYIGKGTLKNDGIICLLKSYEGKFDCRIDHEEYLKLLDVCMYNLVLSSNWIYSNNWITARMIEALCSDSIPLVSVRYDTLEFYKHKYSVVSCYNDIRKKLNRLEESALDELERNKELAKSRSKNFENILLNL